MAAWPAWSSLVTQRTSELKIYTPWPSACRFPLWIWFLCKNGAGVAHHPGFPWHLRSTCPGFLLAFTVVPHAQGHSFFNASCRSFEKPSRCPGPGSRLLRASFWWPSRRVLFICFQVCSPLSRAATVYLCSCLLRNGGILSISLPFFFLHLFLYSFVQLIGPRTGLGSLPTRVYRPDNVLVKTTSSDRVCVTATQVRIAPTNLG